MELGAEELESENRTGYAERSSPQQEDQDQNVPGRPVAVQPGEIPRVKPVVEPSIPAGSVVIGFHDLGCLRVDVIGGSAGVVQSHEQRRQGMLPVAVKIVGIVL